MNKNANITVSFGWVLSAVVGVFFLFLGYQFIQLYDSYQTSQFEITFTKNFNNIVQQLVADSGIEENKLLQQNLFSGKQIVPICESGLLLFQIDDFFARNGIFNSNPYFLRPTTFADSDINYLGVQRYSLPFTISHNFITTSPRHLYIFDTEDDITRLLYQNFEKSSYRNLNHEGKALSKLSVAELTKQYEDENLDHIIIIGNKKDRSKYVALDKHTFIDFSIISSQFISEVTVYITTSSSTTSFNFLDMKNTFDLSKAILFGSPSNIECNMLQIENAMDTAYLFHTKKAEYISHLAKNEKLCSNALDDASEQELYRKITTVLQNIQKSDNIREKQKNIELLIQLHATLNNFDCLRIY